VQHVKTRDQAVAALRANPDLHHPAEKGTPMHFGIERAGNLQLEKMQESLREYHDPRCRQLPFKVGVWYVHPSLVHAITNLDHSMHLTDGAQSSFYGTQVVNQAINAFREKTRRLPLGDKFLKSSAIVDLFLQVGADKKATEWLSKELDTDLEGVDVISNFIEELAQIANGFDKRHPEAITAEMKLVQKLHRAEAYNLPHDPSEGSIELLRKFWKDLCEVRR
jgi:hypothetical protein